MLRLIVLLVAVIGLTSVLTSTPSAGASPADPSERDCLGQLHSALVRSGSTLVTRDPETGEDVVLDSSSNPGDFRGAAGTGDLLALFPRLAQNGCTLPLPNLTECIDFDGPNRCGDPDDDGYWNQQEWDAGSDPVNAASTPEYALLDEQFGSNTCSDNLDNDLDGLVDNGDAGCRLDCKDFGPNDRCRDPDGDGWLTYVEELWGSDPDDASSTPQNVGDCVDFDNDTVCEPF